MISQVKNRVQENYIADFAVELYKKLNKVDVDLERARKKITEETRPLIQAQQPQEPVLDDDNPDKELFKFKRRLSYQDRHKIKSRIDTGSAERLAILKREF